jgi:hypothetical protein
MQYVLHVMSYEGIVPGAKHYRGRVEGEHPPSCHGRTHYSAAGKTCDEGHQLEEKTEWNVEAAWSEERYERFMAAGQPGNSPSQFLSKKDVIDRAMIQFLDGSGGPDRWWEQRVEPAAEGDELWYGWVNPEGGQFDDLQDPEDGWGMRIARKCTT